MKSKVLFNRPPLIIDRDLAKIVGLHEAIVVQQIHYWLVINKENENNLKDGYYWTFNSYREWQKTFDFWNARTIQRLILSLQKKGILITGNFNKLGIDQTKWYRIDYDKLSSWSPNSNSHDEELSSPLRKTVVTTTKEVRNHNDKLSPPLPETTSKTTPKNTTKTTLVNSNDEGKPSSPSPVEVVFKAIHACYGFPKNGQPDPIPNYGKEGKAIKTMLQRGFEPDRIVECWADKTRKRGSWVSMVYVNEDIGEIPELSTEKAADNNFNFMYSIHFRKFIKANNRNPDSEEMETIRNWLHDKIGDGWSQPELLDGDASAVVIK